MSKFHHLIYGTHVEAKCDHNPLEAMLRKPLHKITPRIHPMLLKLMRYKLEIKYVPGSHTYIAGTLSWGCVPGEDGDGSMDMALGHRHAIRPPVGQYLNRGPLGCAKPRRRTRYSRSFDAIHEQNGPMFLRERLIIPTEIRGDILFRLHEGHTGMEKSKPRAAKVMFWRNIFKDIHIYIYI